MKPITIAIAICFALTALPALAADAVSGSEKQEMAKEESEKYPPHKKYYKKKKRRRHRGHVVVRGPRVVVKPVVVHKKKVVVHSSPVVVHHVTTVKKKRRRVSEGRHYHHRRISRPHEESMLGVGLRLSGVTVDGQKLNLATVENPTMWGAGLQLRGKVSPNVGLELAGDVISGRADEMNQTTVPLMLSLMYYVVPDGKMRLFGMLGGGVHLTKLEYDRGFRHDLVEIAGQAGGGLELRLSRDFAVTSDLRFLGVYSNVGSTTTLQNDCVQSVGNQAGFCNGLSSLNADDKFSMGAQFMVGANMYF